MKKNIFICLLIFYKTIFLAQHSETKKEARYEMYAAGGKPVKSITLKNAQKLDDVLESYPNSWISSYQSVKISAINNGDTIKSISKNSILTSEQKKILSDADLFSDIIIDVNYTHIDPVGGRIEKNTMHVPITVYTDQPAEYYEGNESVINYIKANSSDKISSWLLKHKKTIKLLFTINENGQVENIIIKKSSTDENIDNTLREIISNMPLWKPAQNNNGFKAKQPFVISINGDPDSGC